MRKNAIKELLLYLILKETIDKGLSINAKKRMGRLDY